MSTVASQIIGVLIVYSKKTSKLRITGLCEGNYTNPGYSLSLVDTLWNAGSYRQPLEQEGNPMTLIEKFWLQISLIVTKKS